MAARKAPPTNKNTGRPVGDTRRRHLERVKAGATSSSRKARAARLDEVKRAATR